MLRDFILSILCLLRLNMLFILTCLSAFLRDILPCRETISPDNTYKTSPASGQSMSKAKKIFETTFFQERIAARTGIMVEQKAPEKVTPVFDFFEEILPSGNKKLITGSDTTQSSRTGIFTIASIVINNARQRLVQRNEPQHPPRRTPAGRPGNFTF